MAVTAPARGDAVEQRSVPTSSTETLYVVPDVYTAEMFPEVPLPENPFKVTDEDRATAEGYFQRARQAVAEDDDVGLSLRLLARALALDPHHEGARRVWGYQSLDGQWGGEFARRQLEKGEIWHPTFGWIKPEATPRYEAGERPLGNRWITVEEESKRHAKIDSGWRIRTDHFFVTSNHSREAAVELATRLETLYQAWRQMFGGFYLSAEELIERFDNPEIGTRQQRPFQVRYYRTRDEYNTALVRQEPQIAMSLGTYFEGTRTSHFFAGAEQDPGTIQHEAVHQFFNESTRSARRVGALSNAWLLEGVACYFESLTKEQDADGPPRFSIGSVTQGRMPAAWQRGVVDGFYVPLEELSQLGTSDLKRRSDIARIYSQSAGLVNFLMHYEGGIYRPALIETLQNIYAGRDKPTTLQEQTGRSYAELDGQYLEYLRSLAAPVPAASP